MVIRVGRKTISLRFIPILLMFYSALIPLENVLATSIGGSINKYVGLLIIGLIIVWYIKNDKQRVQIPKWMFLFSVFAFCTMFWSINKNYQILSVMINVVFFTLIAIQYPLTKNEKKNIIYAIFIGGVIVSAMMLSGGSFTSINSIDRDRMTITIGGLIVDNNNLAVSLGMCFISGFSLMFKKKINLLKRITIIIGLVLIIVGILRTGSRGGLLALVAGGILFLFLSDSGLRLRTIIIGAACIFFCMYYIQNYMSASLASRFSISEVVASGGTGRMDIWIHALRYYLDSSIPRIFFGYGFGSFTVLMEDAIGIAKAAHNDIIQLLLEMGLVGVILYFKMWIEMGQYAWKNKNSTVVSLLVVVLVGSLSMEMLIKKMLWLAYFIAISSASND